MILRIIILNRKVIHELISKSKKPYPSASLRTGGWISEKINTGKSRASSSIAKLARSHTDMADVIEFQLRIQEVQV